MDIPKKRDDLCYEFELKLNGKNINGIWIKQVRSVDIKGKIIEVL